MLSEPRFELPGSTNVVPSFIEGNTVGVHARFFFLIFLCAGKKERGLRKSLRTKMHLLELFAGTGSVGKIFEAAGWDVTSVDLQEETAGYRPTICADIKTIELDRWPAGTFDVVWASIPCGEYSMAKTVGTRMLEDSDELALHTLALIRALKPRFWFIENPASSLLKDRNFMKAFLAENAADSTVVSYCKYVDWGYRKNTRIFSNALHLWKGQRCANDCSSMVRSMCGGWRHKHTAQRGGSKNWPMDRCFSQTELYRIPPALVSELLEAIAPSLSVESAS